MFDHSVDSWKSNSYIYNFPDGRKAYGYQARHCSCCMGPSPAPLNTTPRGSFRKSGSSPTRYDPQHPPKRRPPTPPQQSSDDDENMPLESVNNQPHRPTTAPTSGRHHRPLSFVPTLPDDRDNYYSVTPPLGPPVVGGPAACPIPPPPAAASFAPLPPPLQQPPPPFVAAAPPSVYPAYVPQPPPPPPPQVVPAPVPPPPPTTPCPRDHNRAPPGDRFCTQCGVPVLCLPPQPTTDTSTTAPPVVPPLQLPVIADTVPRYYNAPQYQQQQPLYPPVAGGSLTPRRASLQTPPQASFYGPPSASPMRVCQPCGGSGLDRGGPMMPYAAPTPPPSYAGGCTRCTCSDRFVCPTCHGTTRSFYYQTSPLYHR